MVYENKIFESTNASPKILSFKDICTMYGLEIIEFDNLNADEHIGNIAKEIIQNFISCLDILLFIQNALSQSYYDLKYSLRPPYTTSNLDCDYVLHKLVLTNLVEDFYYSSLSKSYRILINSKSDYDVKKILSIGLAYMLKEVNVKDVIFNCLFKQTDDRCIYADVVCQLKNKILLFNFEFASGLEKNIPSHNQQLKKLSDKILDSYSLTHKNVYQFFIVTSHCKSLLPPCERVTSVDEIPNIIEHL